jgi:hypothetical protein
MKHGSITLNRRQKDSQWNDINQLLLEENLEAMPTAGKVMAAGFFFF